MAQIDIKKTFVTFICVITSLLVLYTAGIRPIHELLIRSIYLMMGTLLILILYPFNPRNKGKPKALWEIVLDLIFAAMTIYSFAYIMSEYDDVMNRAAAIGLTNWDIVVAVMATIVTLEICRRTTGWGTFAIVVIGLLYILFGHYLPSSIAMKQYSLERIARMVFFSTGGIFGLPMGVMASIIYIFIVFGSFLEASGAADTFLDLSKIVMGRIRGGAGQVPILASALFGTCSGSAVANVVVDGCFTIPLMSKSGYSIRTAGAIEAVASTGGQIMPPVMGVGAFFIAELTGIPYFKVCLAAMIPAILYYMSLSFAVYFEAQKLGLKSIPKEERPKVTKLFLKKCAITFTPVFVVVYFLATGATPMKAGFYSIAAIVVLSLFEPKLRNFKWLKDALVNGPEMSLPVLSTVAAVGIFIGLVTVTGLGVTFGEMILSLAGGHLLSLLLLTALAALILGCGMPTGIVYLIIILVIGQVLIAMKIPVITAHLFVFYFGVISAITPPVAMAAYAAAGISGDNPVLTGYRAFRLGFNGFLVPFAFVYNPGICLIGPWHTILWDTFRVTIGVLAIAVTVQGWMFTRASWLVRLLLLICGIAIITPTSYIIDLSAIALVGIIFFMDLRESRVLSKEVEIDVGTNSTISKRF